MPDITAKLKTLANAVMAWKTGKLGQVGASPKAIPSSKRYDSSWIPLVRSNKRPNARAPRPMASPIQMSVVDISAVFDKVITCTLGKVGL